MPVDRGTMKNAEEPAMLTSQPKLTRRIKKTNSATAAVTPTATPVATGEGWGMRRIHKNAAAKKRPCKST